MKLDVTKVVMNVDGSKPDGEALTYRKACIMALTAALPSEDPAGEEKFHRFLLAKRVQESDEVELTPEDAVRLKHVIGKAFGPLVVGPLYEALNA